MNPTAEQVRRAALNTTRQPRNGAPAVEQARRNEQQQPTPEHLRALERLYRGGAA
ncbi:MAG TPA: hypothetical protein VK971_00485 [Thiohalobacter sp.]|nr:hypothetical protein [Thiohalobacter sp.]